MGSLVDQTEVALGRVLGLCSGGAIVQQDVEALQCHDEAALALLDVNDGDAVKVCGSLSGELEVFWAKYAKEDDRRSGMCETPHHLIFPFEQPCETFPA